MKTPRRDLPPVEAANPEIGWLLGMLQAGTETARRELGRVPREAVVWQPHPNGHSIGAILIHLAACEAEWIHRVACGQHVPGDIEARWMGGRPIHQYEGVWPAPPLKPLSWYYALQDEVRERTIALARELPDPGAWRSVPWSRGRECTVRWILHHIVEHEAYHSGQAVLLRLSRQRFGSGVRAA